MKATGYLNSKSYGVTRDDGALDYLWSIAKVRRSTIVGEILHELDVSAPNAAVHHNRYKHERICAEVFTLLFPRLQGWGAKSLSAKVRPDRWFKMNDNLYYLEVECGNQKDKILAQKVDNYKAYFRETREDFKVLFVMEHDKLLEVINRVLTTAPTAYEAVSLTQLDAQFGSNTTSIMSSAIEEFE